MSSKQARFWIFRLEVLCDEVRPEATRSAHFGNFHIEVHADAPEEGQARRKVVDVETSLGGGSGDGGDGGGGGGGGGRAQWLN